MIIQRKTEINYIESSTFGCVKRYAQNLLQALLGKNPYQVEMGKARDALEKAAGNLNAMQDMYSATLEKWSESQKQLTQMQQLVETLRDHLREKDEQMGHLRRQYDNFVEQMKRDHEMHKKQQTHYI